MDYIIHAMPMNKQKIISSLSEVSINKRVDVSCFEQLESTNLWLLQQAKQSSIHNHLCVADFQTAGMGRNGKNWHASRSKNILMSFAHEFELPIKALSGLSLITGIAIINALETLDLNALSVKWPNDIYLDGKKLGGILIQTQSLAEHRQCAIIGIGLNIEIDQQDQQSIDQPHAQLAQHGIKAEQREELIAIIVDSLLIAYERFAQSGLQVFQSRWEELDFLNQRQVVLKQSGQCIQGRYKGINSQGAARIELPNQQIKEYYVGELSVSVV